MLVQTMNAISRRFQNRRGRATRATTRCARLEIDPLRTVNNLVWGYVQDEWNLLTVQRRAYEYQHEYGISLLGKAIPGFDPADSRPRFLAAFHDLLATCAAFYEADDDTTVIADAFPVLNALKDVASDPRRGRAQPVRRHGLDGALGDARPAVDPQPAGVPRVPRRPRDGPLPRAVDGPRRHDEADPGLGRRVGDALPRSRGVRRAAAAVDPLRQLERDQRQRRGGELGALLAHRGQDVHALLPGGDRRRPRRARPAIDVARDGRDLAPAVHLRRRLEERRRRSARAAAPAVGRRRAAWSRARLPRAGSVPDFTSALYLGLRHASGELRPWAQLTTGAPAAVRPVPGAAAVARELCALQGCAEAELRAVDAARRLGPRRHDRSAAARRSTSTPSVYPILRVAALRARTRGVTVRDVAHHDPAALERSMRGDGRRPVVLVDGISPAAGGPAPLRAYLEAARRGGGLLVVDDTQAVGILGEPGGAVPAWGRGGGGSLPHHGLRRAPTCCC